MFGFSNTTTDLRFCSSYSHIQKETKARRCVRVNIVIITHLDSCKMSEWETKEWTEIIKKFS